MIFITMVLIFSAGFTYLYYYLYSLVNVNYWMLFLWVPLGILSGLLLFVLYALIFIIIGSHTSPKSKFKYLMLKNLCFCTIKFFHIKIVHEGYENVPKNETFVVYANHKSNMDPMLLYLDMKRVVTAVGKKSLFKVWITRTIGKGYGAIIMDRDNDREAAKAMLKAIKDVKNGMNMIIFPEGGIKSREVEEMVNLRAGAYKLAMKPQALILPVSIIGSNQISKVPFYKKKVIKIIYHKPLTPADYEGKNTTEVGTYVEELINKAIHDETNKE